LLNGFMQKNIKHKTASVYTPFLTLLERKSAAHAS
jgi:hypothetical protein